MREGTLSPPQAARYIAREWGLKLDPGTVRRSVRKGVLPAEHGEHGRLYLRPADLHALFDRP